MSLKFNQKDWINYGRWVQPPLPGCFWCHWHEKKSTKEITNHAFGPLLFLDGYALIRKSDKERARKIVLEICQNNRIKEFIELFEKTADKYKKEHLEILNNFNQPLPTFLPNLFNTYGEVCGIWLFVIILADELQDYVLENKIVFSEEEILLNIEPELKKTWLEEQSVEVKNFTHQIKELQSKIKPTDITLEFIKNQPRLFDSIKEHLTEFAWFGTHHWMGEGYNLDKCLAQIREEISKRDNKRETKEVKKRSGDPLWKLFAVLTYWRTHFADITIKVVYDSKSKLKETAEQFGISYDQLIYLSSDEILKNLSSPKINLTDLKEREKGYGCYIDNQSNEQIAAGKELAELINNLIESKNDSVKQIKGIVVSKGQKVSGQVKVLISPKDFSNFKKGDILVAPETTPDFVPYMRLAAAIITERGGITSHAAVVARELGIPCIIGTKIATQVLKDGDRVEVDTAEGIIKIK